ncbi:adp-ribosylation factor-related protein [Anaeramoeba flamelloides]|uniref:Adp-ribosylation factor-related protein n=1 Tax=Anaeramoeba flamelloides TaxID=1746091 RepID=A0ABQ8Z187_9EUKA|nr:adp-ribosylation factor-related protein [Anaeramoeba flamelloides]
MFSIFRYTYRYIIQKPKRNVLILGLQNSGKTSLLNDIKRKFQQDANDEVVPTIGQNYCRIVGGGYDITINDLGGQPKFRETWVFYLRDVDLLIYVIDGSDSEKFKESAREFQYLMENPSLVHAPVLVCINKQDLPDCFSEEKFDEVLNLTKYIKDRSFACFGTIANGPKKRKGTENVINWIFLQLKQDTNLQERLLLKKEGKIPESLIRPKHKRKETKSSKEKDSKKKQKQFFDENENENDNLNAVDEDSSQSLSESSSNTYFESELDSVLDN